MNIKTILKKGMTLVFISIISISLTAFQKICCCNTISQSDFTAVSSPSPSIVSSNLCHNHLEKSEGICFNQADETKPVTVLIAENSVNFIADTPPVSDFTFSRKADTFINQLSIQTKFPIFLKPVILRC